MLLKLTKWLTETEACCCRTKRTTKKKKKKRVNFADAKEKKELDGGAEINAPLPPNKDTKKAKRKFLFLSTLLGLLGYGRERATAKKHATSTPDGGRGQSQSVSDQKLNFTMLCHPNTGWLSYITFLK